MDAWINSWPVFITTAYARHCEGWTNEQLSEEFGDREVIWYGTINEIEKGQSEWMATLDMPLVWIPTSAQPLIVRRLAVRLLPHDADEAYDLAVRDLVMFRTVIKRKHIMTPGIEWVDYGTFSTFELLCGACELVKCLRLGG